MILLEALLYIVGFYIITGLGTYAYAVLKAWEFTGMWNFKIHNGFISVIIPYPRWLLGWLEWIVRKVKR